jgi:hypothetical protein
VYSAPSDRSREVCTYVPAFAGVGHQGEHYQVALPNFALCNLPTSVIVLLYWTTAFILGQLPGSLIECFLYIHLLDFTNI